MLIARIVQRDALENIRIDVLKIWQPRLVKLLKDTGLYLPLEKIRRRHYEVVTRVAGQQLGFEYFVRVEYIVIDFDTGLLLEVLQHTRIDVIRPVIDVDDLLVASVRRVSSCRFPACGAPASRWPRTARGERQQQ